MPSSRLGDEDLAAAAGEPVVEGGVAAAVAGHAEDLARGADRGEDRPDGVVVGGGRGADLHGRCLPHERPGCRVQSGRRAGGSLRREYLGQGDGRRAALAARSRAQAASRAVASARATMSSMMRLSSKSFGV